MSAIPKKTNNYNIEKKEFADIRIKIGEKKQSLRYGDGDSFVPSEISEDQWGEIPKF